MNQFLTDENEIREWLGKNCRINGTVKINNGIVDVDGNVELSRLMDSIKVKFGTVTGTFACYYNKLTTLEGCPDTVGRDFLCYSNKLLKSLKGCPKEIEGAFGISLDTFQDDPEYLRHKIKTILRRGYNPFPS